MLKSYIKIAIRNLKKHKVYSFINIFGLALGMACCILILLWVQDEVRYDRFHKNRNNLYRVYTEVQYSDGRSNLFSESYFPLARVLKTECPDVVDAIRYSFEPGILIKFEERIFTNNHIAFADPSFFNLFTFPFIKGDPVTTLDEKFSVVITEEMSQKYFGSEDPIGKVLNINNQSDLKVTGVIKNLPKNSSFQFNCVIPFSLAFGEPDHWGGNPLETYVLLNSTSQVEEVEQKITGIKEKHDPTSSGMTVQLRLQPLTRIHLYALGGGGLITFVYIFSVIACFVLIIACINFMNLATAKAATRANEIGLRKVVGAKKSDLIKQFFGESTLFSFIAFILALFIVELILPAFNNLSEKQIKLDLSGNITILIGLISIALFTGILSGSYPALFLSSFQPVNVLKRTLSSGVKSSLFRKVLVVSQFSISIFLIIGTMIVFNQLDFIQNRDLGYDKENLVFIYMQDELNQKYESLKNELLQNSNILEITRSAQSPDIIASTHSALDWDGKDPEKKVSMNWDFVDFDYFETFKMEVVEGRSFSREYTTDATEAFIVNEEAAKLMGMESPVGKRFSFAGQKGRIVGVVKNFHFKPLHHKITPFVFGMNPDWINMMKCLFIRIGPDNISETIKYVENICKKFSPDYPFRYQLFGERINRRYRNEQRMGTIVSYFTSLTILISCLGLFGLASFMVERRTKEIGIRKVLGSSVSRIVLLLTKEFTKWVLIANIIAWPVAYFILDRWLQNFAYSINVGPLVFILAAVVALMIALLTVSYQAVRAAMANPVESLRYE